MAEMAKHSVTEALGLVDHFDEGIARRIDQAEEDVDRYEDMLGTFAVKLNNMSLSESEGRDVSRILHGIGDFERISDHAVNLTETAREIAEKQVKFTEGRGEGTQGAVPGGGGDLGHGGGRLQPGATWPWPERWSPWKRS